MDLQSFHIVMEKPSILNGRPHRIGRPAIIRNEIKKWYMYGYDLDVIVKDMLASAIIGSAIAVVAFVSTKLTVKLLSW